MRPKTLVAMTVFSRRPPPWAEPAANDVFRHPFADLPAIDIGRVEKVNAKLMRLVHNDKRIFLTRQLA